MPSFILPVKTSLRRDAGHADGTSLTAEDFAIMSSYFYTFFYGAMKFVGGMLVDKLTRKP